MTAITTHSCLSFAAAGLLLVLVPCTASAEPATVQLKNGASVTGELLEYKPQDHVTLDVGTGSPLVIQASKLESISIGSSSAPQLPAATQNTSEATAPLALSRAPAPRRPKEPTTQGINLGLRLGYALPWGQIQGGNEAVALSKPLSGQVPLIVDLGYRFDHVVAGIQFQYGFVFRTTEGCGSDSECSDRDVRLALNIEYRVLPYAKLDPWVSAGVGLEWLYGSRTDGSTRRISSGSLSGVEMLSLAAGLDYRAANHLAVGPFLSLSVAQYNSVSGDDDSASIEDTALHGWVTLGVRGNFDWQLVSDR